MLNNVILIGRLTKKPEIRKTKTDMSVTSFSLAVDGRGEETNFFDIVVWDKQADNVCNFLDKGSLVAVNGELSQRKFQRKDGSMGVAVEVIAHNVTFLEAKKKEDAPEMPNPDDFPPEEERPPLADGWEYGEDGKPRKIKDTAKK